MRNKLNTFEAISIISLIMITQIILSFPVHLINLTGTGVIINIAVISIIGFIFCFIISKMLKNFANFDIIDISEFVGGNFFKFIISIIFILFLLISTIIVISDFLYLIRSIYFYDSNLLFLFSFFIIIPLIANLKGFYSIKKIICVFFPILALSLILLLMGSTENVDINNFLPIFGYNTQTTFGIGLQNIFILNFILLYFFILPNLKKKNDFSKIVFSSFWINIIFLLISLLAVLLYFPTAVTKSLNHLGYLNCIYLITRKVQLTNFIRQTDAIFIFIWSFAIFAYSSFCIYGINYILDKLFHFEDKTRVSFSVTSIIFGCCLIANKINVIKFLEAYIFKYFSIILVFGICFILLIFANIKNKKISKLKKGIYNETGQD